MLVLFVQANAFSEGKAYVYKQGNRFIDTKGRIPAQNLNYICINGFKNGYATIYVDNKFGYIDKSFNIIIKPIYEIASYFNNGKALVGENPKKFYLINTKGEKVSVFPKGYTFLAMSYNEGLLLVKKNNKKGYMDMKGNIKIDCIFDAASIFKDGYTNVMKDGKVYIIDCKGNVITDSLPKDFMNIGIRDNMIIYNTDKGTTYYTLTGKIIFSSAGD